jgi:hypothetical protein
MILEIALVVTGGATLLWTWYGNKNIFRALTPTKFLPEPSEDVLLAQSIQNLISIDPDGWKEDEFYVRHAKSGFRIWKGVSPRHMRIEKDSGSSFRDSFTNNKTYLEEAAGKQLQDAIQKWRGGDKIKLRIEADAAFNNVLMELTYDRNSSREVAGREFGSGK